MNELLTEIEKTTGLQFSVVMLLFVAGYMSVLVFPSVNDGRTELLVAGVVGFWGLLFEASRRMLGWKKLFVAMANNGLWGIIFLAVVTGGMFVTTVAILGAFDVVPVRLLFN